MPNLDFLPAACRDERALSSARDAHNGDVDVLDFVSSCHFGQEFTKQTSGEGWPQGWLSVMKIGN